MKNDRIDEPYSRGRRAVLSSMTKRHFAGDETALCGRRNGTLSATKRYFVDDETALRQNRKKKPPSHQEASILMGLHATSGLFADVSEDTSIDIEHVAVDGVRSVRGEEYGGTTQLLGL